MSSHSLFGFEHFSTHITFDFGLSMCIFFGGFQLVDYIYYSSVPNTGCLTLKCAIVNGPEGWKDQ